MPNGKRAKNGELGVRRGADLCLRQRCARRDTSHHASTRSASSGSRASSDRRHLGTQRASWWMATQGGRSKARSWLSAVRFPGVSNAHGHAYAKPRSRRTNRRRQITDATGRFVFTRLPGGRRIQPGRHACGIRRRGFRARDHAFRTNEFRWLTASGSATRRITLYRHNALSGTVLDEAGEPMVGRLRPRA
jgi:hypothetical protein